jgi:hypothetical protein
MVQSTIRREVISDPTPIANQIVRTIEDTQKRAWLEGTERLLAQDYLRINPVLRGVTEHVCATLLSYQRLIGAESVPDLPIVPDTTVTTLTPDDFFADVSAPNTPIHNRKPEATDRSYAAAASEGRAPAIEGPDWNAASGTSYGGRDRGFSRGRTTGRGVYQATRYRGVLPNTRGTRSPSVRYQRPVDERGRKRPLPHLMGAFVDIGEDQAFVDGRGPTPWSYRLHPSAYAGDRLFFELLTYPDHLFAAGSSFQTHARYDIEALLRSTDELAVNWPQPQSETCFAVLMYALHDHVHSRPVQPILRPRSKGCLP